jgi:GDSL-like lipase/acylhydrolase family protein
MGLPAAATPTSTLYPVAKDFYDTLPNLAPRQGLPAMSSHARLGVLVPIGTTSLSVRIGAKVITPGATGGDIGVPVFVDGAYSQTLLPTAVRPQDFTVTLDGAAHAVEFWASLDGSDGVNAGNTNAPIRITGTGITIAPKPTPTYRLVVYGDSIASGFAANPAGRDAVFAKYRQTFGPSKDVAFETFGGRRLFLDIGTGDPTAFAQRLVSRLEGAPGDFYFQIGVNDINVGYANVTAFVTAYTGLIAAVHALAPTSKIYAQTMTVCPALSGNEVAYRTAMTTACTGLPQVTVIPGLPLVSSGNLVDGLHPNSTGHIEYFGNVRVALGL